jgi:hypothetical protein
MVEFRFSDEQRARAMAEGHRRQSFNEARNTRGRNKGPATGAEAERIHLLGAAAEVAVACYLEAEEHLFLETSPVRGSCDLPGIDVKCGSKHSHNLLVQLDDNFDKIFVLVTIENRKTFLHGFLPGHEIPARGTVREPVPGRPCYFIEKKKLLPMKQLKATYLPEHFASDVGHTIPNEKPQ